VAYPDELARLIEDGVIDAVHSRLMSGKEATVYVVERDGHLGAAKVYKARDDRTFKKVSGYTEGRNQTRNTRDRRAMANKSSYGRGLMEEGWQDMEFRALQAAFQAGVRVPEPYLLYENVLLMELLVDEHGAPAARVADLSFTAEQAVHLHHEIFMQAKGLLETGWIHGDLSAYNVLMAAGGPTIIDLPQVVEVARNTRAGHILMRDLRNVTEHLARFDARLLRFANCGDALYRQCSRGMLDQVTGPEESVPQSRTGGRRGREAERGRVGREKGARPEGSRPRWAAEPAAPPGRPKPDGARAPQGGPRSQGGPHHPGGPRPQGPSRRRRRPR
jgi:RIO kinase 1